MTASLQRGNTPLTNVLDWALIYAGALLNAEHPFIKPFVNKNYTYAKLNYLKFNSALNDPKRIDVP